jgi:hypothetical protein
MRLWLPMNCHCRLFDGCGSDFDFSKSKLLIDGANVTSMIEFADGVITFSPRQIKGGPHNIELNLYDAGNNMIGKKEWSFRAGGQVEAQRPSNYRGSVFMEERYQDVSDISDNLYAAGVISAHATPDSRPTPACFFLRRNQPTGNR